MPELVVTHSEYEALIGLCDNLTADQIALKLGKSASTVKNQLRTLYAKLGVHAPSSSAAAALAVKRAYRIGLLGTCPTCYRRQDTDRVRVRETRGAGARLGPLRVVTVPDRPGSVQQTFTPVPEVPEADPGDGHTRPKLTARLVEVLQLLALGYSKEEIAEQLDVSINTIRTHMNRLFHALRVNDKGHAVAIGFAEGYLKPEHVRGSNTRKE